jgi:hypothetical protein
MEPNCKIYQELHLPPENLIVNTGSGLVECSYCFRRYLINKWLSKPQTTPTLKVLQLPQLLSFQ